MTRERRLVFSLDDLNAIRWQCPKCQVSLVYRLDERIRFPRSCPACAETFGDDYPARQAIEAAEAFVQALKAVRAGPLRLQLEMLEEILPAPPTPS